MKYSHLVVHESAANAVREEAKRRGVTITRLLDSIAESLRGEEIEGGLDSSNDEAGELPFGNDEIKELNRLIRDTGALPTTVSISPGTNMAIGMLSMMMDDCSKKLCVHTAIVDRLRVEVDNAIRKPVETSDGEG